MRGRTSGSLLLFALSICAFPAQAAVSLGTMDTFDGGFVQGWVTGSNSPNPLVGVAGGGPEGGADGYLLITSNGSPGPGGRLVAFPGSQWLGDYVTTGVTAIKMQANNLGASDLALRLSFVDASFSSAFTSQAVALPSGSGWSAITFDVRPTALTGSASVLGAVTEIRLYHNPAAQLFTSSPNIAASVGIDNVTAVPEPQAWMLFGTGVALVGAAVRRSRMRSSFG